MLRREIVFGACPAVTPDFAARLAHRASGFEAEINLEFGTTQLCVDSLIGILAMDLRRGARVSVRAEGRDEQEALDCICALLERES